MRSFRCFYLRCRLVFLGTIVLLAAILSAMGQAPNRQRLVLKDGSYQVITKYEVTGDRVRFYSAERDEWEEIPMALIDWPATAKWNHDHQPGASAGSDAAGNPNDPGLSEAAKLDAEERAERDAEAARIPLVAPGLRLPDETGVWGFDTYQDQPELVHVLQANGDLNRATEHSIVRANIVSQSGAREAVRIEGASAAVQFHVNDPVFYVSLDASSPATHEEAAQSALTVDTHGASSAMKDKNSHSSPESRYVILRVTSNRNLRTILAREIAQLAQPGHSEDVIETSKQILPGGRWMKITPKEPLLIGEYALVEVLSPREVNLDVWAFGVNPRARENKNARTAVGGG
ncbi:MAG: hypothetical protein JOZ83_03080 [Silvibacterium sp.]|nr:hypothetical protein [Silvibacterium sp.]